MIETEEIAETLVNTDRADRPEKVLARLFEMKPLSLTRATLLNGKYVASCNRRYYYYCY
jgi:hypothetical protein